MVAIILNMIFLVCLQNAFGSKASGYRIITSKYVELNQSRTLFNNSKTAQSPGQKSQRKYNSETGFHFQQHKYTPSVQRVRDARNVNNGDYSICVSGYCLPKDYEQGQFPRDKSNDEPVTVKLEFNNVDILVVNDIDFTVTFRMNMGAHWNEPRIIAPDSNADLTPLDLKFLEHLWLPDLEILHLKQIRDYRILKKLAGLWISNETVLFYSQWFHVTTFCSMRFDLYPLDKQDCKFEIGSYSYDTTFMNFQTILHYNEQEKKRTILDYHLQVKELKKEDLQWYWEGTNRNYSLAGFEMKLKRHTTKYIVEYYLPSGLFVITSWVSFLIDPHVIPGRMTLLVTLFLVLINIFNSVSSNSPNVEGFTAISTWVISCILFVFAALVGYAGILFKIRYMSMINRRLGRSQQCGKNITLEKIDLTFFIMFPIVFIIFNLIYWLACDRG